ncbi:DUF6717 family protein [Bythopirellula polymerisocia]|uniref:Uncharacterized protein n=1 Tax=Bythopirellula polymerisocia TaxID=2528003 RepID=A0A5C6CD16_9BACT|nr:DUF6717 family protein [Bythopirellula polymerisocia]TWU22733.1 hypothetical protein Pla144_41940 [Bythopirellula polymerisocia]
MSENSISVIKPYKWEGLWVFDDERVGLDKEPFVAGADTLIDVAIERKGIANAQKGFLLLFSATSFPSADLHLEWVREEASGNVYKWADEGMEGWLCPALLKYFDSPPAEIYVQLKNAS